MKETWKRVVVDFDKFNVISMNAAQIFYDKLFEIAPNTRYLFKNTIEAQV